MCARIAMRLVVGLLATGCKGGSPAARSDGMITIPAASFVMGCDGTRDPACSPTEQPAHPVSVGPFALERTEVTQEAYSACVVAGACTRPARDFEPGSRPAHPVTHVTWEMARTYCRWRGWRLPREAEWERAARGDDGRMYPWGNDPPDCTRAHLHGCGAGKAAVGTRVAGQSVHGVLDLAGNVDEWVEDVYAPYGGGEGKSGERVARGGAYDAWHSRSTARSALAVDHQDALLGFRCAADVR